MFCEHNAKLRKEGLCTKCSEAKPFKQFKTCKNQCYACKECGWFYGPGAEEGKVGKPVPEPEKTAPTDFNGVIYPNHPAGWKPLSHYTSDSVKQSLAPKYDTYYAKLAVGRPDNWVCNQATKDNFCLSQWLLDELTKLQAPQEDRIDSQHYFNRKARAEDDQYEVAARAMNNYLDKKIERYRRIERS